MLKNYLVTAFRNLYRERLFTVINLFGLSIGIACCILILLYVHSELSYDKFHSKSDRIYRVWVKEEYKTGQEFFNTVTPYALAGALREEVPEIDRLSQLSALNWDIRYRSGKISETVHMVSPTFFEIFDFDPIVGTLTGVMDDARSIVLARKAALKYFGRTNVVGEELVFEVDGEPKIFEVRAVVEDPPLNSSISFNMLVSDVNLQSLYNPLVLENWFNVGPETYVLLHEGTGATLENKFKAVAEKYVDMSEGDVYTIGLQPLTDIHLNPDFPVGIAPVSNPKYAYILGSVALLILILACINFVLLSISKSVGRAKEVGVRKSVGAFQGQIIQQFLSEAIVTVFVSLGIGMLLVWIFLPFFNGLSGKELQLTWSPFLAILIVSLVIVIGLIAGFYPAFVVSKFDPAHILKGGSVGVRGKKRLRQLLVGVQFVLSLGLIASTIIMTRQLEFLRNKDLGFDKQQLVSVQLPETQGNLANLIGGGLREAELFRSRLLTSQNIAAVTASAHDFSSGRWIGVGFTDEQNQFREFNLNVVTPTYVETLGLELVMGRDFMLDNDSDKRRAVIVNQTFADKFGIESLNDAKISRANFGDHEIIGIVKDFNYYSLHGQIEPLVLTLNPSMFFGGGTSIDIYSDPTPKLLVRLQANRIEKGIGNIRKAWSEIEGEQPFDFQFVDNQLEQQYRSERNLGSIISIASILAIIVGGLGLFALASLNIHNQMRELSIRKVLGASEVDSALTIVREYLFLIGATLLIATPITWYIMSDWLSSFTYRIPMSMVYFLISGFIATSMAMISISYHTVKAIRSEPVEFLKYE